MIAALFAALLAIVPTTVNTVSYACDGSTAAFTINYAYQKTGDLAVTSTDITGAVTTLAYPTDFTLSVTSTQSTATLTLTNPASKCPNGNTLKIARAVAPTQLQVLNQQTLFFPSTVMQMVDRDVMAIQDALSSVTYNLSGSAFANQGTTQTVLHGNGTGDLSFSQVNLSSDVTGLLPMSNLNLHLSSTLSGLGTTISPIGIDLSQANTWTGAITDTAANNSFGCNGCSSGQPGTFFRQPADHGAVGFQIKTSAPSSPGEAEMWVQGNGSTTDQLTMKLNGSNVVVYPQTAFGCSGDLNAGCSQVVGLSHAIRKTPPDASNLSYWTIDESALSFVDSGTSSSTNLTTNGASAFSTFAMQGMFGGSAFCGFTAARCGARSALASTFSPAAPISIWYWFKPLASLTTCSAFDGVFKAYRTTGSWSAPFVSVNTSVSSTCAAAFSVTVTGSLHTVTSTALLVPYKWNLIAGTYDGANICVSVNAYPQTCTAQTGAIDYNSNAGFWGIGMGPDDVVNWTGAIDDVHVDSVARSASYFATVYQTATLEGGQ